MMMRLRMWLCFCLTGGTCGERREDSSCLWAYWNILWTSCCSFGCYRIAKVRKKFELFSSSLVIYDLLFMYWWSFVVWSYFRNCPIDLKEAVTSVLFASQRISDVPELSEICKQFTTKYGKDFATSAIELRPDSGVSRLVSGWICSYCFPT